MTRVAFLISVAIVGWLLGSPGHAQAQSFVTEFRMDCDHSSTIGSAVIHLFRDGVQIAGPHGISCQDGGFLRGELSSVQEPDSWVIQGGFSVSGIPVGCPEQAGTRFPEVYQCGWGQG